MATPQDQPSCEYFLEQFGTPTLLWRALEALGYTEPPRYYYGARTGALYWFSVTVVVPAREGNPSLPGWQVEREGMTPEEGAQAAALEVLMDLRRRFPDASAHGPAGVIPSVDPATTVWEQAEGQALVRGHVHGERADSSCAAVSAMFAVLKLRAEQHATYQDELAANKAAHTEMMRRDKRLHGQVDEQKAHIAEQARQLGQALGARDAARAEVRAAHAEIERYEGRLREAQELAQSREEARRRTVDHVMNIQRAHLNTVRNLREQVHHSERYVDQLQRELHVMQNRLYPIVPPAPPAPVEGPGVIAVDKEVEEEEPEDPEMVVLIVEGDDFGGNLSGMDDNPDA